VLAPKKQKFRKQFRGVWKKIATSGDKLNFGTFGLKTMDAGWIKDRQIEAVRVVLARATRKEGKFWIRMFPDRPYSKKPPEVTMGAGKGDIAYFVAAVSPGRVLFEIDGLDEATVKKVMKNVTAKLSLATKIVKK